MSKEYRDTLNLPETDLSMKAGLPRKEPEILEFWNSINLYQKIREQNSHKEKFILHDGPPYSNGDIHLGHAVNKTLKDITIKFQRSININYSKATNVRNSIQIYSYHWIRFQFIQ